MRLKGGKVLIDLSFDIMGNEPYLKISEETCKAILEKGCDIKFKTAGSGNIYVLPFIISYIDLGNDDIRQVSFVTDADKGETYDVILKPSDLSIKLEQQ